MLNDGVKEDGVREGAVADCWDLESREPKSLVGITLLGLEGWRIRLSIKAMISF